MEVRKANKVRLHQSRCFDLIDSIEDMEKDAVASAIVGLIEDIFSYTDGEPPVEGFVDELIDELKWHT